MLNLGYYSIEVGPGANFTLSDCTSARTQGYIDTDGLWKPGATVPAGAMDYDLIGGVITGEKPTDPYYSSHRSVVLDGMYENHTYSVCTFTMEGGNIAGSPGGGVFVSSDSTFNMSGGQIIHNTSNSNVSIYSGGGVYV